MKHTIYSLDFDAAMARTMRNAIRVALERWPGGDSYEQQNLHELMNIFNTICLEEVFNADLDSTEL